MSWVAIGAAAVTAGAGLYTSSKNKKDQKALMDQAGEGQDIGGDILSYIQGYKKGMPGVLNMEKKFRPEFQQLNLREIESFFKGRKGQEGLIDLNRLMNDTAGDQLERARRRDLEGMVKKTGLTRNLMQSMSPEGAAMVKQAQQQALTAQQAAKGLTWQENRSAQQFARESSADRGRAMDNSSIASELLNRDSILGQKRQEAAAATQNAFNLSNQFYSQPGLQSLSQMPQSYQAGQGLMGIGLGSLGSSTPQLVNPDMGVNTGAANRQNQLGAASAASQMAAANNAAMMNMASGMFNSYMQNRA